MIFSVIIPTYNRISLLKNTLESLFRQDFRGYEIIVVNDGSTDGTDGYLSNFSEQGRINYIKQPNMGPASARNAGLRCASGTFIAFTDDDCVVPRDWLSRFHQILLQTQADIAGGKVKNCVNRNIYSATSQEITNHFVDFFGKNGQVTAFLTSNNVTYRAETLRKAGGFDEKFRRAGGEERALNLKIVGNGGRSLLSSDVIVEHHHKLNFRSFFKQQFNYGRGAYILYRFYGNRSGIRPGRIPSCEYVKIPLGFLKSGSIKGFVKLILYIAAQLTVLCGFIYQALMPASG